MSQEFLQLIGAVIVFIAAVNLLSYLTLRRKEL